MIICLGKAIIIPNNNDNKFTEQFTGKIFVFRTKDFKKADLRILKEKQHPQRKFRFMQKGWVEQF